MFGAGLEDGPPRAMDVGKVNAPGARDWRPLKERLLLLGVAADDGPATAFDEGATLFLAFIDAPGAMLCLLWLMRCVLAPGVARESMSIAALLLLLLLSLEGAILCLAGASDWREDRWLSVGGIEGPAALLDDMYFVDLTADDGMGSPELGASMDASVDLRAVIVATCTA